MSLRLTGVAHRYAGGSPVLTGIDLEVGADETVAIVGPSGSGKTTLLSILGGLLMPTEGRLELDGTPVGTGGLPPGAVGWVFQTVNLFPHRMAWENVAIAYYAIGGLPAGAMEAARRSLAAVGVGSLGDQLAMRLSGGEAQRVGVARALLGPPRFVLADEPTGQLDRSSSERVADALINARPTGTSLITATHDVDIAARCRRQLVLADGRLIGRQA
jgi:predicted ABC-type transport system involved in lysophospholipase L1 biosynthesis ATPase subunit